MAKQARRRKTTDPETSLDPGLLRRVVVEGVHPQVDCGRFPIKRIVGDAVVVSADIHADGHDRLAAVLLSRRTGEEAWHETAMVPLGNDRWRAQFTVESVGRYQYTIEGWVDRFSTWREELSKKFDAGQDVSSELLEGAALVRAAIGQDGRGSVHPDADRQALADAADAIADTSAPADARVATALSTGLQAILARHADRSRVTRFEPVLEVVVDRERAEFGAWYELFPRSAGPDPTRSATFEEAAALLPYIASMGFDVLYLPPVHPIGRSFRKGRNNSLTPEPGDPGSPWAIGSAEGGHMAVEPGLGTIADFDRFVEAAATHGLEIAIDIAYQASPDHPYVREHPEWFRQRPDGSIKYAENPPKKYQDIYPFNFESAERQALWIELKRVIEFWIGHGVRIFRVDNPHTKPYRFWQWALDDLTRRYPDTIYLSEAFTRPRVMEYLAKSGFTQSYTYFTWRNTKDELTEYLTELTRTRVREYLRPNLFANTPDILHAYLQRGGRPAFRVRLVLAATLGASYGIYSGFELAENVPVRPGSEEYLDSEKYQITQRQFDAPESLAGFIGRVNAARRAHPALRRNRGLRFHQTDNPDLICYSRRSVDGTDVMLMVVNLDPFHMQHGFIRLPLADWGLDPGSAVDVVDLLSAERYYWRGERNYVRLDPDARAAHILHVQLPAPAPPQEDEERPTLPKLP